MAVTQHVDVVVVGAGLSGVGAAYRLATECPDKTYAVLEARAVIGGTWDLFRYPGVRSDSDMFTLGYPFRPWRAARAVADGPSILRYIEGTAREAGIDRRIRYRTKLTHASWSSDDARWTLTLQVAGTSGEPRERFMTCSFLYLCSGYYDYERGYTPDLPGLADFAGTVVHPQFWPQGLDWTGKRVLVVGSGATAVTLVPSLAPAAAHVTMLQRSPSYINALPSTDPVADTVRRLLPPRLAHGLVRAKNVAVGGAFYELCRTRPDIAKRLMRKGVVEALGGGPDAEAIVDEHFTPTYDPWDQRVCLAPDGDFFQSLTSGRASVVTDRIDRFVAKGVRLASGPLIEADIVVTATGLVMLPFGGVGLTVDGDAVDVRDRFIYRRMMLSGVPNAAAAVGYTNASWTLRADISSRFVCRLLRYLDRHDHDYAVPVPSGSLTPSPAMELTSGYVRRGMPDFPSQGHRAPWSFSRRYPLDALTMRTADLRTEMTYGRAARRPPQSRGAGVTGEYQVSGGRAVVTGAASGMGEQLSYLLAAGGSDLVLVDRDEDRLTEVAERIVEGHPRLGVETRVVDLADREATHALGRELGDGRITLLVNNAGVGLSGRFDQVTLDEFEWLFRINFHAHVQLTHLLLPALRRNAPGTHVANVSSIYGLVAPPGAAAYAASKFALRGFSESLRQELMDDGIAVTTVHPGGIATRITENSRRGTGVSAAEVARGEEEARALLTIPPEKAAQQILDGVVRRRPRVLIGLTAQVPDLLSRIAPTRYRTLEKPLVAIFKRLP